MLTRKVAILLILSISSIFLGLVARNSYAVVVSIPLISSVIISLILHSDSVHTKIAVNRTLSKDSIYEDETVDVTLEIRNLGSKLDFIQITDQLSNELSVSSGSNRGIIDLNPGESFVFSYKLVPRVYGFHNIGPTIIDVNDTQFMISKRIVVREKISVLKVFPKIQYVPKISISPKRTKNWPGEIIARRPGPGMEFYSLREYQQGDPVKSINWRSSSRYEDDRLFTNQFKVELGGDSIIAVDVRTISAVGDPPDSTDVYSVRAAATMAHRLLRDRNRVGMIILGAGLDKVPSGFGKRQFDRILTTLCQVKPERIWEIGNLGGYLSLFFSAMVQVILVTPLMDERSFHAVMDICGRGFQVLVISPSSIPIEKRFYAKHSSDYEFLQLAERLLRIKRENRLNALRRYAVVVDWDVDTPLAEALQVATHLWNVQKNRVKSANR